MLEQPLKRGGLGVRPAYAADPEAIMKPAALLTVLFLSLVALLHLVRMIMSVEVAVDGTLVPLWVSIFGVLVPGGLAFWLRREQQA